MLNEFGYEMPDDTPVSIPARLRLPTSRASQIQAYIRAELSRQAADAGQETFEEANDLDVEEMGDFPMTEYERSGQFGMEDVFTLADARGPAEPGAVSPGGEPQAKEGAQPPADKGE